MSGIYRTFRCSISMIPFFMIVTFFSKLSFSNADFLISSVRRPLASATNNEIQPISADTSAKSNLASTELLETNFENYFQIYSIFYGLIKVANKTLVGESCLKELALIQQGVADGKLWALKAIDASATKSSGFMFQQNFWLGSRETCATVNEPLRITLMTQGSNTRLITDVAPFSAKFVIVYLKLKSSWQLKLRFSTESILHLGLCVPTSCSLSEIEQLISHSLPSTIGQINEHYAEDLYAKDLQLKDDFYGRSSLKILLIFLIFTIAMSLVGPLLHVCANITPMARAQFEGEVSEKLSKAKIGNHKNHLSRSNEQISENTLKVLVKCFNIDRNVEQMFAVTKYGQSIPIVSGLRSVFSLGVVIVHVIIYMMHTVQNLPFLLSSLELKSTQLFNLPFIFVDGFFAISAFLQTFHFLQDAKGIERIRKNSASQNIQKIWVSSWHRYLRLAPLYLVTMCVGDLMSAYINDVSLFHIYERYDKTCSKYWWRNLLFIQSFYPMKEMCLNWSWSLSCEMLYSIVSSVSLIIYVKNPKSVKFGVLTLLAFTIVWTILKGTSEKFKFGFESFYLAIDNFYMNPLLRGVPFIIGSIAAWYFVTEMRSTKIHPMVEKLLWNLSLLLFFGSAYTMYWRDLDYVTSTCFYLLGRILMALSVSWFIIGGIMGTSTWWSRILEAPIFQHVSRLTYAIYLLNPIIITLFVSLMESSVYVDPFMIILYSCGFWVITYMVSIIFSLMFEVPFHNWSRIILKNYDKKTN